MLIFHHSTCTSCSHRPAARRARVQAQNVEPAASPEDVNSGKPTAVNKTAAAALNATCWGPRPSAPPVDGAANKLATQAASATAAASTVEPANKAADQPAATTTARGRAIIAPKAAATANPSLHAATATTEHSSAHKHSSSALSCVMGASHKSQPHQSSRLTAAAVTAPPSVQDGRSTDQLPASATSASTGHADSPTPVQQAVSAPLTQHKTGQPLLHPALLSSQLAKSGAMNSTRSATLPAPEAAVIQDAASTNPAEQFSAWIDTMVQNKGPQSVTPGMSAAADGELQPVTPDASCEHSHSAAYTQLCSAGKAWSARSTQQPSLSVTSKASRASLTRPEHPTSSPPSLQRLSATAASADDCHASSANSWHAARHTTWAAEQQSAGQQPMSPTVSSDSVPDMRPQPSGCDKPPHHRPGMHPARGVPQASRGRSSSRSSVAAALAATEAAIRGLHPSEHRGQQRASVQHNSCRQRNVLPGDNAHCKGRPSCTTDAVQNTHASIAGTYMKHMGHAQCHGLPGHDAHCKGRPAYSTVAVQNTHAPGASVYAQHVQHRGPAEGGNKGSGQHPNSASSAVRQKAYAPGVGVAATPDASSMLAAHHCGVIRHAGICAFSGSSSDDGDKHSIGSMPSATSIAADMESDAHTATAPWATARSDEADHHVLNASTLR